MSVVLPKRALHPNARRSSNDDERQLIRPAALMLSAAAAYVGLSESGLQALVRGGSIPKPRQLSERRVAWLVSELDAWLESRPVSEILPPKNCGRRRGLQASRPGE